MLLQITQRIFLIIQCLPFNLNIIFCSVITDAARVILKVVGSDTIAMLEHGKWIICAKISNRQRILWSYFEILLLQINFYIAISNRSVVLWCKVHFLYCHSKHDLPPKKKNQKNKKYNFTGPPAFKSQRVRYQSYQKLLHHYQHSKKLAQLKKKKFFRCNRL